MGEAAKTDKKSKSYEKHKIKKATGTNAPSFIKPYNEGFENKLDLSVCKHNMQPVCIESIPLNGSPD